MEHVSLVLNTTVGSDELMLSFILFYFLLWFGRIAQYGYTA